MIAPEEERANGAELRAIAAALDLQCPRSGDCRSEN